MTYRMNRRVCGVLAVATTVAVVAGTVNASTRDLDPLGAEDVVAIEAVLERYSIALNNNDWAAYSQVFAEDAVQEWASSSEGAMGERLVGLKAIVNLMVSLPRYKAGTNDHLNVNSIVWRDQTGTVRSWSYYLVPMPDGTVRHGEYLDVFVKTRDGWRISYRRGNQRSSFGAQSKEWYGPWWLSSTSEK